MRMRISVIIPTLNEARHLAATLASTRCLSDAEVITVDGGSRDETVAIARMHGARVLVSGAGRAKQMNCGAWAASSETLLFLHADSLLPVGYDEHVFRALERNGIVAGAFLLRVDGDRFGLRIIEMMANWRSRRRQLPYGDQGIFLDSKVFHALGGFPNLPIMEDYELMVRLRRRGRIAIAPVPVVTSARRWNSKGILRTTLINQLAIAAYWLGVSPQQISRWYHGDPSGDHDA